MNFIFQLIGILLVVLVLFFSVMFFLDSKNILRGDFGDYISYMHNSWIGARDNTMNFLQDSGVANDAADLLDKGSNALRKDSNTTTGPSIVIITPEP